MNLRQLQYLLAIADEGSFTRAAEQLLVAQPSLSQQIKSLEQELGGPLLERLPTGARLTAAGSASATSRSARDRRSGTARSSSSDGRSSSWFSQRPTRWPGTSGRLRSRASPNATGCCSGPTTDSQS